MYTKSMTVFVYNILPSFPRELSSPFETGSYDSLLRSLLSDTLSLRVSVGYSFRAMSTIISPTPLHANRGRWLGFPCRVFVVTYFSCSPILFAPFSVRDVNIAQCLFVASKYPTCLDVRTDSGRHCPICCLTMLDFFQPQHHMQYTLLSLSRCTLRLNISRCRDLCERRTCHLKTKVGMP